MNVLLGVTGSISAYKAADITSRLSKLGHNVDVMLTESGAKFITPLCKHSIILEKDLLLKGLNIIYKKNKK